MTILAVLWHHFNVHEDRKPAHLCAAPQWLSESEDRNQSWRDADPPIDEQPVKVNNRDVEPTYTETQGQYLALIYYFTKIHGVPPAEADMQRYFNVSAPSVHNMVVTLEKRQLIQRTPGAGRSIQLLLRCDQIPDLE